MSKRWQMYPSRLFKRWGFSFMCIAVLWLPYFTGDHKIILGENDIPNPNDVNLYTITIEGLFVQLIKTRFFQAFSHRCEVPRVSRPILQETQTLVRTTWLCDANFEGKPCNWSDSFFSKNKLKNVSIDVILDTAICYWGSRDTDRVKIKTVN